MNGKWSVFFNTIHSPAANRQPHTINTHLSCCLYIDYYYYNWQSTALLNRSGHTATFHLHTKVTFRLIFGSYSSYHDFNLYQSSSSSSSTTTNKNLLHFQTGHHRHQNRRIPDIKLKYIQEYSGPITAQQSEMNNEQWIVQNQLSERHSQRHKTE